MTKYKHKLKKISDKLEKIFATHVIDKGLIYLIHKEYFKIEGKKIPIAE